MTALFFVVGLALLILGCALLIGVILIAVSLNKRFGVAAALGFLIAVLMVPPALALVFYVSLAPKVTSVARTSSITIPRDNDVDWGDAVKPKFNTANAQAFTPVVEGEIRGFGFPEEAVEVLVEAQPNAPAAAWSETDLGEFEASLYPGLVECAAPLARKVGDLIERQDFTQSIDDDSEREMLVFVVYTDDSLEGKRMSVLSAFARSLENRFPGSQVIESDDDGDVSVELKEHEFALTLSASVQTTERIFFDDTSDHRLSSSNIRMKVKIQESQGHVTCRVRSLQRTAESQVKFVDKPWVAQFDQLVSKFPNKQFVVGYSDKLASSEPEARQSAMKNAQAQVRIAAGNGVNTLIDETSVIDRFAQKLSRPYGDVWREAVLVDITGEAMRGSVAVATARAAQSSSNKRFTMLGALILVFGTVAICFVANTLTQGYYRQRIQASAGTAMVLVLVAAFLFVATIH